MISSGVEFASVRFAQVSVLADLEEGRRLHETLAVASH